MLYCSDYGLLEFLISEYNINKIINLRIVCETKETI